MVHMKTSAVMQQVSLVGFYIKSSKTILIIYNVALAEQGFPFLKAYLSCCH